MCPYRYPARQRQQNVSLIQCIIMARSESEFDAGRAAFSAALHPSLFSELDFMEESIPTNMLAAARGHVDGLFEENFTALLRLRDALAEPETVVTPSSPDAEALLDALAQLRDASSVPLFVQAAIQNAVLFHLDDPPSRMKTKAWLRDAWNGRLPHLVDSDSIPDLHASLAELLDVLASQASEQRLGRVVAVVRAAQQFFSTNDLAALRSFDGEWAAGVGPCESCAMRFASTGQSIIDPSTFNLSGDVICLPLFNIAECPFCGHVARLSIPLMFHWPQRAQIVYCVPLMLGQDEAIALREARPMFDHLRTRHRDRLSPEAAAEFDRATELVTHSMRQFLSAIQMGTTEPEWHAYNLLRLIDGTWLAVDVTKGACIYFTDAEYTEMMAERGNVDETVDQTQDGERLNAAEQGELQEAMTAFKAGDFDLARQQLETLLTHRPDDEIARRNLAVVYVKLGKAAEARRLLAGARPQTQSSRG